MKTPEERGPVGAWAYTARQDAELSVEEVADRLGMRGVSVSPATLRGVEGGSKKPGRALLRALSEVYGVHPPSLNGKAASDYAEIVAAIHEQTAMLRQVLEALTPRGPTPQALRDLEQAETELAARRGAEDPSGVESESAVPPPPGRLP